MSAKIKAGDSHDLVIYDTETIDELNRSVTGSKLELVKGHILDLCQGDSVT